MIVLKKMMTSLLMLTIIMSLEMRILFEVYQNPRSQQLHHLMRWSHQQFYHIHDAKNLTIKYEEADLLHWHYCLGYSLFKMLKALVIIGILPCCLAKAHTSMCPACSFAKMHQKPCQTKGQHKRKIGKKITKPGHCVSVD